MSLGATATCTRTTSRGCLHAFSFFGEYPTGTGVWIYRNVIDLRGPVALLPTEVGRRRTLHAGRSRAAVPLPVRRTPLRRPRFADLGADSVLSKHGDRTGPGLPQLLCPGMGRSHAVDSAVGPKQHLRSVGRVAGYGRARDHRGTHGRRESAVWHDGRASELQREIGSAAVGSV